MAGILQRILKNTRPLQGRTICEDGSFFNVGDHARGDQMEIARGNKPGAEGFMAFGERKATEAETRQPVLPVGDAVNIAASGDVISISSGSADDTDGGTGINSIRIIYLRQDLTEQEKIVTLNGTTPVEIGDTEFRFIQCMHANTWGSAGPVAAGDITAQDGDGNVYSLISSGEVRCTSAFRMVPAGKVLYVDSAFISSISGTAEAKSDMQLVVSEILGEQYIDPLGLFPYIAGGVQDGGTPMNCPPRGPYSAGTVVGALYTSDKAATVTATWFGRLEPAS